VLKNKIEIKKNMDDPIGFLVIGLTRLNPVSTSSGQIQGFFILNNKTMLFRLK
jgi:hypothetical protein